jgi:hypothetical protein
MKPEIQGRFRQQASGNWQQFKNKKDFFPMPDARSQLPEKLFN